MDQVLEAGIKINQDNATDDQMRFRENGFGYQIMIRPDQAFFKPDP